VNHFIPYSIRSAHESSSRASSPRIISYTEPTNLEDVVEENSAVTKSGATITYGPYRNTLPYSNADFVIKKQQTVTVHYNHDFPVLEVTKLKRTAEISHWGANLNIQNEIHLHNAGPE
jgi:oligosaccharyltransferase complex subunit alpha (ribophorin I)